MRRPLNRDVERLNTMINKSAIVAFSFLALLLHSHTAVSAQSESRDVLLSPPDHEILKKIAAETISKQFDTLKSDDVQFPGGIAFTTWPGNTSQYFSVWFDVISRREKGLFSSSTPSITIGIALDGNVIDISPSRRLNLYPNNHTYIPSGYPYSIIEPDAETARGLAETAIASSDLSFKPEQLEYERMEYMYTDHFSNGHYAVQFKVKGSERMKTPDLELCDQITVWMNQYGELSRHPLRIFTRSRDIQRWRQTNSPQQVKLIGTESRDKSVQQSVPGYPPQGVGSPEP